MLNLTRLSVFQPCSYFLSLGETFLFSGRGMIDGTILNTFYVWIYVSDDFTFFFGSARAYIGVQRIPFC